MGSLVEFLRARLDEDERAARLIAEFYPPPWEVSDRGWMARVVADDPFWEVIRLEGWPGQPDGPGAPDLAEIIAHIARHDPARVLAEVEAKRRIIAEHYAALLDGSNPIQACRQCSDRRPDSDPLSHSDRWLRLEPAPCLTVRLLALQYAGHADYRKEWRP